MRFMVLMLAMNSIHESNCGPALSANRYGGRCCCVAVTIFQIGPHLRKELAAFCHGEAFRAVLRRTSPALEDARAAVFLDALRYALRRKIDELPGDSGSPERVRP